MDQCKYTTLVEALAVITDPRHARGQRYSWLLLLTLTAIGVASGQRTVHAIADWIRLHWDELCLALKPDRATCPSEPTFRRTLRLVSPQEIEAVLARLEANPPAQATPPTTLSPLAPTGEPPLRPMAPEAKPAAAHAQAIDGKALRGAQAHGEKVHLVSLVRHADAVTTAQTAVEQKSNEIPAVPQLISERDLTGTVTTMDALLTQRTLAQQILDQGGHYFMVVKANQPELQQAIALLFERPPGTKQEHAREYQVHTTANKGHGRLERRTLECSTALTGYVDWPGVGQVMRRTCRRVKRKTGEVSETVTYGITSLTRQQANAQALEAVWRGHWTIENRVHYVRDVTLGEDACQTHVGNAPRVLAALRDVILNLLRACGWENISDAVRHYAAKITDALSLISRPPTRL
jgi:predicted transposase YbfD/YdcC